MHGRQEQAIGSMVRHSVIELSICMAGTSSFRAQTSLQLIQRLQLEGMLRLATEIADETMAARLVRASNH